MGQRPRPDAAGPTVPRVEALIAERLTTRLDGIWDRRLGLVVAPPGAGKSTLLASYAAGLDSPVAWYQADRWDVSQATLVARLAVLFEELTGGASREWGAIDDVIAGVSAIGSPRLLIVIDDLHVLEGSPAEQALERLVARGPARLHVLAGSRTQPRFNLSRLRVANDLLEVHADDLRFRAWEVERLFRDFYHEPLAPVDLARLTRWTEGWAAGLQLFHLATRGRPADDRRRVLGALGPRSRLAREYLAQNALARVRDELRRFLLDTSVLGRLDGPLCDRLLDRSGSEQLLDELERRCLFTTRDEIDGSYRYHEVFRAYLQGVLVADIGEDQARARFVRAGDLLMAEGAPAEALEAYMRAEAWEVVERLLGSDGAAIAESPLRWLSLEAQRSLREDAWLGLAGARRLRAEGRFEEAVQAYGEVARGTRTEAAANAARRERSALQAWLQPDDIQPPGPRGSWWALLRQGLQHDPRAVAREAVSADDAGSRLVAGVCLLLAGDLPASREVLSDVAERPDAEGVVACLAQLARGTASLLGGDPDGVVDLNGAVGAAEGLGWEWLARIGRSLLAISGRPDHLREAAGLQETASAHDDHWGEATAALAQAWGILMRPTDAEPKLGITDMGNATATAAASFGRLGAPVMEAWVRAVAAVGSALAGRDDALRSATEAGRLARAARIDACDLMAQAARAVVRQDAVATAALAETLQSDHGISLARLGQAQPVAGAAGARQDAVSDAPVVPPASLRMLAHFELRIGGDVIDVTAIRPRVRTLLYLLASHVGTPLHREVITELLWSESDPAALARNLHVAVASLRRVLEPQATRGGFRFVLRDGESYLLSLPPGSEIDVIGFETAAREARQAYERGDHAAVERWCRNALDRYTGELLPEVGPADWVIDRREALRALSVQAAELLARALLERGDSVASAAVCAAALERDRYHDPLWRTLIEARETAGDEAAAKSARSRYRRALAELDAEVAGT